MMPVLLLPALIQGPSSASALEEIAYFEQLQGLPPASTPRSPAEARAFFLYSLTMVTDWPGEAFRSPQAPLVMAVLGDRSDAAELEAMMRRTVHGRPIRLLLQPDLSQLEGCHVVYVSTAASGDLPYVLRALRGRSILLIGETPNLTQMGGMVFCDPEEGLLPTEVNVRAAKAVGLTFRSHFLKLVRRVAY
jgi:hypothetical protein